MVEVIRGVGMNVGGSVAGNRGDVLMINSDFALAFEGTG